MKSKSRAGFTLIELMVAMALMLFIMVILSEAFVLSLDTFRSLKAIGDMQENLRTADILLRDDLRQDHFTGKRRLSDLNPNGTSQIVTHPLQEGFFAVVRSSPPAPNPPAGYIVEGVDSVGLPSYRAVDQMLYMTVKRKGNRQEHFFNTALQANPLVKGSLDLDSFFGQTTAYNMHPVNELPTATWTQPFPIGMGATTGYYASQWAEVYYFLVRTGSTEEPSVATSALGTPTYSLMRAQFVMVPDRTGVNTLYTNANGYTAANIVTLSQSTFSGMSCNPTPYASGAPTELTFYSPADAALGQRMIPDLATFSPTADPRFTNAANLVLPNVISFHVQVMPTGAMAFQDVPNNGAFPYGIYDTAKFGTAGYSATGLKAIQITLRVWDNTARQTRQITIVQDL